MDRITKAKVSVITSIIKLTIDIMAVCEDNVELDVFRKVLLDNINSMYLILHEENRGVKNE